MQLLKVVQQAVLVAALLEIVEAVGQDDPELREVVESLLNLNLRVFPREDFGDPPPSPPLKK